MSKRISTAKVLELTLMSRFTLCKKVKEGNFPRPVDKCKRGLHLYDEDQVRIWMEENLSFITRRRTASEAKKLHLQFKRDDMNMLKKAARLLDCDMDVFAEDAVIWKAKKILENAGHE